MTYGAIALIVLHTLGQSLLDRFDLCRQML